MHCMFSIILGNALYVSYYFWQCIVCFLLFWAMLVCFLLFWAMHCMFPTILGNALHVSYYLGQCIVCFLLFWAMHCMFPTILGNALYVQLIIYYYRLVRFGIFTSWFKAIELFVWTKDEEKKSTRKKKSMVDRAKTVLALSR